MIDDRYFRSDDDLEKRILKRLKWYGIFLIILSAITFIFAYEYVFPIGSIILLLAGIYVLFRKKINNIIRVYLFEKRIKKQKCNYDRNDRNERH